MNAVWGCKLCQSNSASWNKYWWEIFPLFIMDWEISFLGLMPNLSKPEKYGQLLNYFAANRGLDECKII